MGKQYNKAEKRQRRERQIKRKKVTVKLAKGAKQPVPESVPTPAA
jgi:hypothetical protein